MPMTVAPTSFAYCSARTRFGLMFFSRLPPPTENTKIASLGVQAGCTFSHSTKTRRPALVVGARGQLGDVVGRRVALDAGDLAEIVDGVRAVAGAAADAEEEQPAAALLARSASSVRHRFDRVDVEPGDDLARLRRRCCCA